MKIVLEFWNGYSRCIRDMVVVFSPRKLGHFVKSYQFDIVNYHFSDPINDSMSIAKKGDEIQRMHGHGSLITRLDSQARNWMWYGI